MNAGRKVKYDKAKKDASDLFERALKAQQHVVDMAQGWGTADAPADDVELLRQATILNKMNLVKGRVDG
jgi:hypothetical protein